MSMEAKWMEFRWYADALGEKFLAYEKRAEDRLRKRAYQVMNSGCAVAKAVEFCMVVFAVVEWFSSRSIENDDIHALNAQREKMLYIIEKLQDTCGTFARTTYAKPMFDEVDVDDVHWQWGCVKTCVQDWVLDRYVDTDDFQLSTVFGKCLAAIVEGKRRRALQTRELLAREIELGVDGEEKAAQWQHAIVYETILLMNRRKEIDRRRLALLKELIDRHLMPMVSPKRHAWSTHVKKMVTTADEKPISVLDSLYATTIKFS